MHIYSDSTTSVERGRMVRMAKRRLQKRGEPEPSKHQLLIRAVLWAVAGALAGQMTQTLPFYTSVWGVAACGAALLSSHYRRSLSQRFQPLALVAVASFMVFCGVKAWQEYAGSNYPLYYEACGTPTFTNGYVDGVIFGIEWVNPNKNSLWAHMTSHELEVEDRRSKLPAPDITAELHTSKSGQTDGYLDDTVAFDPPLTLKPMSGTAHFEFDVGPNKKHLHRHYVIDGFVQLVLDPGSHEYQFRYTPTSKGDSGFEGYCDISNHIHGRSIQ